MKAIEFLEKLSDKVPAEALTGLDTVFHFDISGDDGGQKTVVVSNGSIEVKDGLHDTPKCVVSASSENLASILKGDLNPMMAMMTGKLKISNPGEMLKYAKLFGLA